MCPYSDQFVNFDDFALLRSLDRNSGKEKKGACRMFQRFQICFQIYFTMTRLFFSCPTSLTIFSIHDKIKKNLVTWLTSNFGSAPYFWCWTLSNHFFFKIWKFPHEGPPYLWNQPLCKKYQPWHCARNVDKLIFLAQWLKII